MRNVLSRIVDVLANEPIWRKVTPLAVAHFVVGVLLAAKVVSPDVAASLTAFLAVVGTPLAVTAARRETTGPVTAAQMMHLPGTDPAK